MRPILIHPRASESRAETARFLNLRDAPRLAVSEGTDMTQVLTEQTYDEALTAVREDHRRAAA